MESCDIIAIEIKFSTQAGENKYINDFAENLKN